LNIPGIFTLSSCIFQTVVQRDIKQIISNGAEALFLLPLLPVG